VGDLASAFGRDNDNCSYNSSSQRKLSEFRPDQLKKAMPLLRVQEQLRRQYKKRVKKIEEKLKKLEDELQRTRNSATLERDRWFAEKCKIDKQIDSL
jgi:predicted ribosome quality control (RQC) complex YloA/Tae2 family protein